MSAMDPMKLQKLFTQKLTERFSLNLRDVKKAFGSIDTDNNGLLSIDELGKCLALYLNGVPQKSIQGLVELYDTNGDGMISYEEFINIMRNPKALQEQETRERGKKEGALYSYSNERKEQQGGAGRNRGSKGQREQVQVYVGASEDMVDEESLYNDLPPAPPSNTGRQQARGARGARGAQPQQRGARNASLPPAPASEFSRQSNNMNNNDSRRPDSRSSVFSFRDEAADEADTETVIDLSNPKQLEGRSQAYLNSLRALLRKMAAGKSISLTDFQNFKRLFLYILVVSCLI